MIEVVDNFLDRKHFQEINKVISTDEGFSWYFSKVVDNDRINEKYQLQNYFFIHSFYENATVSSKYFRILQPLVEKINPLCLLRIRANLYTRHDELVIHGMHIDHKSLSDETTKKIKTCVFYLDNSDGKTVFASGEEVNSSENRIAFFPGDAWHSSTNCTNMHTRKIININYIPM